MNVNGVCVIYFVTAAQKQYQTTNGSVSKQRNSGTMLAVQSKVKRMYSGLGQSVSSYCYLFMRKQIICTYVYVLCCTGVNSYRLL